MKVQGVQDVRAHNGQEIDFFEGILNIISFRFRYHGGVWVQIFETKWNETYKSCTEMSLFLAKV